MTGDYEDRRFLDIEEDVKPLIEPTKELIDVVSVMAQEQMERLFF